MIEIFNINNNIQYGILDLRAFAIENGLSVKREIESYGKNYLVKTLFGENTRVFYNENGKPYLKNSSSHISISHSHDKLALIINKNEATGIDIELIRNKVLKIKHKFLSESELLDANDDIEKLLIYWAAKETLYKIYGLKEINFIGDLFINSFDKKELGTIVGEISLTNFREKFELSYQIIDNYVLVYSLKKTNC